MYGMFMGASSFNADIGGWDVSSVIDMGGMFNGASSFNADIGGWDVSSVQYTYRMFMGASSFNADIGGWDVSSVLVTYRMFMGASSFNADIGGWDVSSVFDMGEMFAGENSLKDCTKARIHESFQEQNPNWEYDWGTIAQQCTPSLPPLPPPFPPPMPPHGACGCRVYRNGALGSEFVCVRMEFGDHHTCYPHRGGRNPCSSDAYACADYPSLQKDNKDGEEDEEEDNEIFIGDDDEDDDNEYVDKERR